MVGHGGEALRGLPRLFALVDGDVRGTFQHTDGDSARASGLVLDTPIYSEVVSTRNYRSPYIDVLVEEGYMV